MKIKENPWVLVIIAGIAITTRLIPHYPNFTALGAAALFGGAYLSKRYAFLIPVVALFVSDLILNNTLYATQFPGNYEGFVVLNPNTLWTYGALILIVVLGMKLIRNTRILPIVGTSMLASTLFFLISNFAVWMHSAMYPKTIEGLIASYTAGLPFYGYNVAGDLFYVAVLFGGLVAVRTYAPNLIPVKSKA
jgi:hypothetical protein